MERIGRRWTGAIVQVMLGGASRYCEIRGAIPGISDRLLTERLKELETEAILTREVSGDRPPQVFYRLSEKGRALSPVLDSITTWAHRWKA
ncbi:MAG TPA: winged helix-turn-helix transcriptional regulator [Rectinemataceae bacterium]|nr:winged helix-turn-helix transcriptional regulator [Rectinemataceae bacterium]